MKIKGWLRKSDRGWFWAGLFVMLVVACAGYRLAGHYGGDYARLAARQESAAKVSRPEITRAPHWWSQAGGPERL